MNQKGSVVMLVVNRSVGVTPEMSLRNPLHVGEEACKQNINPAFETRVDVIRGEKWVLVAP